MRLINTATLQLKDFLDDRGVRYAILSHRWEDEEVTFQDMQSPESPEARSKKGFPKIQRFCQEAAAQGFSYAWIDTCCIDKSSSAELSEAINSMFRWYQKAAVCLAYLSDVAAGSRAEHSDSFARSAWFTRGWTLQELLAPDDVHFYDKYWQRLGSKDSLKHKIQAITNIDIEALEGRSVLAFSIYQRMSWASTRVTSRPEDKAYSLLGIFDVNMPMLYGEGDKAFLRLQEEIIKRSDDRSIFAWVGIPEQASGLLAPSPAHFIARDGGEIVRHVQEGYESYSMTNQGLSIELMLTPWAAEIYLAILGVDYADRSGDRFRLGIFVRRLEEKGQYTRVEVEGKGLHMEPHLHPTSGEKNDVRNYRNVLIKVRQGVLPGYKINHSITGAKLLYGFKIEPADILAQGFDRLNLPKFRSRGIWNSENGTLELRPGHSGWVVTIQISRQRKHVLAIQLGFSFDFSPVCIVVDHDCMHLFGRSPRQGGADKIIWDTMEIDSEDNKWESVYVGDGEFVDAKKHRSGLRALKGNRKLGWSFPITIDNRDSGRVVMRPVIISPSVHGWEFRIQRQERLPLAQESPIISSRKLNASADHSHVRKFVRSREA